MKSEVLFEFKLGVFGEGCVGGFLHPAGNLDLEHFKILNQGRGIAQVIGFDGDLGGDLAFEAEGDGYVMGGFEFHGTSLGKVDIQPPGWVYYGFVRFQPIHEKGF